MKKLTAILMSSCLMFAASATFADEMMKKDGMAKDHMAKDEMKKDGMAKEHMAKDEMKK